MSVMRYHVFRDDLRVLRCNRKAEALRFLRGHVGFLDDDAARKCWAVGPKGGLTPIPYLSAEDIIKRAQEAHSHV